MNKKHVFLYLPIFLFMFMAGAVETASAFYPARKWTYRVKPDIQKESTIVLDDLMILESTSHTLHFVNMETGEKYWQFAFYAPLKVYRADAGSVVVISDNIIHKLDISNKKKMWSFRMKKNSYDRLLISPDENRLMVQYGENSYEVYNLSESKYPAGTSAIEPECRELAEQGRTVFNPSVAGDGTELVIVNDSAVLKNEDGVLWTFKGETSLAQTAEQYGKDELLLVSSIGRVYFVNITTGESRRSFSIGEYVKMRFWDEKPESIDNYSDAVVMVHGDDIFITGPSSISKFRIQRFPESVSLEQKEQDTTFAWALEKAIKQWDDKNYTAAVRGMQEVVDVWPDASEAHLFMGMALSTMGKVNEAINELDRAYELDPQNPDIISNLSGNYVVKIMSLNPESQLKKVIELYEKVRNVQPENKMAYIGLAELYIGQRNYAAAKEAIEESFDSGFFSPDLHLLLLSTYYMEGSIDEALALGNDIQRLFPEISLTSLIKGKLYCKDGRYASAVKSFENYFTREDVSQKSLASLLPRFLSSGYSFFFGNAYGMIGEYDKGIAVLESFIEKIPNEQELKTLKDVYAKRSADKGDTLTVEEEVLISKYGERSYIEIEAETEFRIPALLAAAHFHVLRNENKKAVALIDEVKKTSDIESDTASYMAYILCNAGEQLEEAKKMAENAFNESSSDSVFMRNRAVCLSALGDTAGAEKGFIDAIEKNSDTELLHYEYGKLLLKMGKKKEALEQFREETKVSPDIKITADALAKNGGK